MSPEMRTTLLGWNSLICSNLAMPVFDGPGSLFPHPEDLKDFSYSDRVKFCNETQGRVPDFDFTMQEFGGFNPEKDFKDYSNIAFVNGELDPWLPGCVNHQINENMPVFTIKGAAHHLDSFLPRKTVDSESLVQVRNSIIEYI
jgi:hypothetical protein